MNLFWLDKDLDKCAEYSVNSHVIKIILEAAQCMCTSKWLHGEPSHYKPTHSGHGTVKWVNDSLSNYIWTGNYGLALCKEYTYRYGKIHKTQAIIESLLQNPPSKMIDKGITSFYLAMPDEYKTDDAIQSYRNYYNKEKQHLFAWKGRSVPYWVIT